MITWLRHFTDKLRSSFWFLPAACVLLAGAAAAALLAIDTDRHGHTDLPLLSPASADGVRLVLSTIAGSVLTLAAMAFSATLVALSLASAQFGPRLLRNFIRSRTNQLTLGILLGTFVFCLVVLRRVHDGFVPQLAATGAFLLALAGLAAFIAFVHSIVSSMQAETIVAEVHRELRAAVERFFPEKFPSNEEERQALEERGRWEEFDGENRIDSDRGGYLQALDLASLIEETARLDTRVRVLRRPGHFIHPHDQLLALPAETDPPDAARQRLRDCFLIGPQRTAEQDFEFAVRQLVEVSLRALSPGVNDPFTALNCIDFLGEALATMARRALPRHVFRDADDQVRVRTRPTSFEGILDTAFRQLRQAGAGRPDVAARLLESLAAIAAACPIDERREAVHAHARAIASSALERIDDEGDRRSIEERRDRILEG